MRISDWSSDVCSSDLITCRRSTPDLAGVTRRNEFGQQPTVVHVSMRHDHGIDFARPERKRTMVEPFQATRTLKQPTVDQKPTLAIRDRSEEHTSELQSLMRISYAVFCLKKKKKHSYD